MYSLKQLPEKAGEILQKLKPYERLEEKMKGKVFLVLTLLMCYFGLINAQLLLYEDFTGLNVNQSIVGQNGWVKVTESGSELTVKNLTSLNYNNYNYQYGNYLEIPVPTTTTSRISKSFSTTNTSTNTIFLTFLLNLSDANTISGRFFSLRAASYDFGSIFAIETVDSKYKLGIDKDGVNSIYLTSSLNFNETYLICMRYSFVSGTSNDLMYLWVNPQLNSEPLTGSASISQTNNDDPSITSFDKFCWHNESSGNSPTGYFDAIRIAVGTTSAEAWENLKALRTATYSNTEEGDLYHAPQCTSTGDNQPIGRFKLNTDNIGALLDDVSLNLNLSSGNTESIIGIKLWKSSDDSFDSGTDTPIASTNTYATTINFENINLAVLQGDSYYFVTVDLVNATGQINPKLSAISLSNGIVNGFTADSDISDSDTQTLPVTLSSFNGVYNNSGSILLKWSTQSETNMLGYHVYRSDSIILANADRISDCLIQAQNQSTETHYQFSDEHFSDYKTYYYWLSSCELDGTIQYYGPVMIKTNQEEIIPPVLISETCLHPAYPNPANPSSMISFDLSEDSHVEITLYNIKGQLITKLTDQTYTKGKYQLIWDGKDQQDKYCTTGVYFYQMKCKNYQSVKKLMIIK